MTWNLNIETKNIYSIRELNSQIRAILNREFPQEIWVYGEIQDYDRNKHKSDIYFRLCEKHPEVDEIIASVNAVIFEDRKPFLFQQLKKASLDFELKDNLEVKLLCRVDLFLRSGKFILIVEGIDPFYSLGKIAQSRQRLIEELKSKGLLEKNKKIPLPLVILNIGLITAYNSAAYNDFIDELKKSGYGFKIYFFNSVMQGKQLEHDICRALDIFSKFSFLDSVVITRGGGSTADLSWFDNKVIAEKIANFKLPILTGIGHEINITVADLVAHSFFKTPTALAQFLIKRVDEFLKFLNDSQDLLLDKLKQIILKNKQKLELLSTYLDSQAHKFLSQHKEKIIFIKEKLFSNFSYYTKNKNKELEYLKRQLNIERIEGIILKKKEALSQKYQDLISAYKTFIKNSLIKLKHYQQSIDLLNPKNILKKGFSITKRNDGKVIKSIEEVNIDEELITLLVDGEIKSKVKNKQKG